MGSAAVGDASVGGPRMWKVKKYEKNLECVRSWQVGGHCW